MFQDKEVLKALAEIEMLTVWLNQAKQANNEEDFEGLAMDLKSAYRSLVDACKYYQEVNA